MLRDRLQPMFNLFCRDIDRQVAFYQKILGWDEIKEYSSPIYRVLTGAGIQLGFNGLKAYDLLGLANRQRPASLDFPISVMFTSIVQDPGYVDEVAKVVPTLGGHIVHGPFPTYYGHWQLVFEDPEGNVSRVTCPSLPTGVSLPLVEFR